MGPRKATLSVVNMVHDSKSPQVRPPGPDRSHPDRTGHFWTPQKTPLWGGLICWTSPKTPVWGGLICWTSPKTPVWGGLICWTPPKTPVWGGLICGHQVDRDRGPGPYPVASPVQNTFHFDRFLTMFSNLFHILCSKMKMTSRTVQTCSQ